MAELERKAAVADEKELEELSKLLKQDETYLDTVENGEEKKETYVRITPNKEEAWLYLAKAEDDCAYSTEDIMKLLHANGVSNGFIMSNIIAMAKKKVYERAIRVAVKTDPQEGKDGYYDYLFDLDSLSRKSPRIRADGSVDYNSMNLLENVSKGDVVARYHHSVPGKPGYYVDGEEIAEVQGKELPPLSGKGFNNIEDPDEYRAELDGKLEYKDGVLNIRAVHEVREDVTLITGKIEFYGDIILYGSVEAGVVIRAGKTLTIEGTVEAADIIAGGDIILKRGMQGSNRGRVISRDGSIYADFLEHTNAVAKKNIESNTILNSQTFAEGKVILTGKKGQVMGGHTYARMGIEAVTAGNIAEVKTVLEAGLREEDHEMNQELMKKDVEIRDKLLPLIEEMTTIMKQEKLRELNDSEESRLISLNRNKEELVTLLKENRVKAEKMNAIIADSVNAEIRIEGNIYRGVVITIDTQTSILEKSNSYMAYRNTGGVIEQNVIVKK